MEKKKYRQCPYCKRKILSYLKGCPYCGKEIKETVKKKKPFFKKLSRIKKRIDQHDNKNNL